MHSLRWRSSMAIHSPRMISLPTVSRRCTIATLAMMRVALVDIDRLHTDPATGLLVDMVTMTGSTPQRGHTISTVTLAYTLLSLRTALRSLGGQLELYSNNTPDTAIVNTPLDHLDIDYPTDSALTFSARIEQILHAHAQLLYDHLTDATGRAWSGWDVVANAPVDEQDLLDAHTAAVRGLFAAYSRDRETSDIAIERSAVFTIASRPCSTIATRESTPQRPCRWMRSSTPRFDLR